MKRGVGWERVPAKFACWNQIDCHFMLVLFHHCGAGDGAETRSRHMVICFPIGLFTCPHIVSGICHILI